MREKSNSITHLVKIVAEEVFIERDKHFEYLLETYHRRISKLERKPAALVDHSALIKEIASNLEKAGKYWSKNEDQLLVDELKTAIATIAKNHSRSRSAIASRIIQKELIEIQC